MATESAADVDTATIAKFQTACLHMGTDLIVEYKVQCLVFHFYSKRGIYHSLSRTRKSVLKLGLPSKHIKPDYHNLSQGGWVGNKKCLKVCCFQSLQGPKALSLKVPGDFWTNDN